MFKRLPQNEIEAVVLKEQSDRLFMNLYHTLAEQSRQQDDITAEEIWLEAKVQIESISQSKVPTFKVDALHSSLCAKFRDIENYDGKIIHRSYEEAENSAFLVEITILYQLICYQRSWDNHPYKEYCIEIYKHIAQNKDLTKLLERVRNSNDRYEKVFGSEIPEYDYMPAIVKDNSVIKEALTISMHLQSKLSYGYTTAWLQTFWTELIGSSFRETLIQDLQGNKKYTVIYSIIGILLKNGVFNAKQKELADLSQLDKPNKDSIRRYISSGYQGNDKTYDKFVTDYVIEHPKK